MEAFQRMSDPLLVECPSCTQPALKRRIGTGAGFIFKGGGFYETDFKEKKGAKTEEKAGGSDGGKEAASGPADKQAGSGGGDNAKTADSGSNKSGTSTAAGTGAGKAEPASSAKTGQGAA